MDRHAQSAMKQINQKFSYYAMPAMHNTTHIVSALTRFLMGIGSVWNANPVEHMQGPKFMRNHNQQLVVQGGHQEQQQLSGEVDGL